MDAGWAGLYVITVTTGQTTVTASNITTLPQAPFVNTKLPQQTPGTRNLSVYTPISQGNWTAPAGITAVKLRIWAGGGAGGAGASGAGGGGGAGGYCEGFHTVTAGQAYFVTVGNGGVGTGTPGGGSGFASLATATGGLAGANGAANTGGSGGGGGTSAGGGSLLPGQVGGTAFLAGSNWVSGRGGSAYAGAGAESVVAPASGAIDGHASTLPGAGGAGGVGSGLGGQGGPGLVMVEW